MHGVECCGENPQDAPSFHSYVSSVPEFRVRHKKSPFIFSAYIRLCLFLLFHCILLYVKPLTQNLR